MGRKVREFRPNEVLAEAIYSGLSALVRLSNRRKNDLTEKFYEQIRCNWEEARIEWESCRKAGSDDFSSIQNKEPVLRRLYLQMFWHSTVKYGNKEFKRVYSWREGTVGPLNELLNYMGALLRDVLVPRYYFPDPCLYEIRKHEDGRRQILPKEVADRISVERKVRAYLKAGYPGNSKRPRVLLTHPSLPALDFVDMIRAHLIELCRQCFIHAVPRLEAHRYLRLLVHRLIPFLDWVYTHGEVGRKDFFPDADRELRKIVLEIRTHFSDRSGISEGISRQIEAPEVSLDIKFLRERVEALVASSEEEDILQKGEAILGHIKNGNITDREISRFIEEVVGKAQREGNDWHRVLLSGFYHPRSLKEAVYAGDQFLQTRSGIQYLAEVPVIGNHAAGKIDLVLFVRVLRGAGQCIWIPVMILEVKTKEAFNFNIYGVNPRTKKEGVFAPVLYPWKVRLTGTEWNAVLGARPPKAHLNQLDAYEEMILTEFESLVDDPLAPKHMWKGVVTLDVSQDFETTKKAFDQLIDELVERLLEGEIGGEWKTLGLEGSESEESVPRVAITMTRAKGPVHLLKSIIPVETTQDEDPFIQRMEDDVFFTQYISVPSPTASGKSAAWLSSRWHLLNHLSELTETSPSSHQVIWIDLLGDYPSKGLIRARFGLDSLRKKKLITQHELVRLSGLLKEIIFINIRDETDDLLFARSSSGLKSLRAKINSVLQKKTHDCIIVVDGWSDLESMMPSLQRTNLQVFELSLLQVLRELATEVIWIDNGVNHQEMSRAYQRPCVSPLHHKSPRRQFVDEILWNLPTAPRREGWLSPQYDETRIIIQSLPIDRSPWTAVIRVPLLRGWTRKFSAATRSIAPVELVKYTGTLDQQQDMYGRSFHCASIQVRDDMTSRESLEAVKERAFSLIPSLWKHQQEQIEEREVSDGSETSAVAYHPVDGNQTQPSMTSRLHLDLNQPPPLPNRLAKGYQGIHVEADKITRGWAHREQGKQAEVSVTITRRPPRSYSAESALIDTVDTKRRELQRVLYAATYLMDRASLYDSCFSLYQEIINICDYGTKSNNEEAFLDALVRVKEALLRRNESRLLWNLLLDGRLNLGSLLGTTDQRSLKLAQKHNPEILELYGMNLFLAVLSVAEETFSDVETPSCINLWSAISRWQLYQMGLQPEDDDFKFRYDFHTLYENLLWRAERMKKTMSKERIRFPEQFGQLLWQEGSEGGSIWLLFPSSKNTLVGGLLEGQMSAYLPYGWYRGVIDPEEIKAQAESAISREGWEVIPIALVETNRQQILYIRSEQEDGEEWTIAGAFEYGFPPKERSMPVRWIRLSDPLPETLLVLHGYRPSSPSSDAHAQYQRVLQEAANWSGVIREVSCLLTINLEKKVYRIDMLEGSKAIARKETPYTDEIIRFLRYPLRTGEYFSTPDGTYLKWNPLKDIEYDEVMIKNKDGKRECYHLSVFKPFIHRSTFFSDILSLPSVCEDLLSTINGGDIILRITVNEQKKDYGFRKYLKVRLEELHEKGRITGLESEEMGIYDVGLLAECGQLVDADTGLRYTLSIDAEALVKLGLVHLLSDYSNLESAIIGHIEELESAEPDEIDSDMREEEVVLEEEPELRFVKVGVEESVRRKRIDVNVQLCDIKDEGVFEVLTLLSLSTEIAKTRSIAYEYIDHEIRHNLRGRRVSEDTRDEILRNVERALQKEKVRIDYY